MGNNPTFVQFAILKVNDEWRLLPLAERKNQTAELETAMTALGDKNIAYYTCSNIEPDADLIILLVTNRIEDNQNIIGTILNSGLGKHMSLKTSLIGLIMESEYVKHHDMQAQSISAARSSRYIIIYPFTKTAGWYLENPDRRKIMMLEHIKIGKGFKGVKQMLLNSFGIDDQDFVVAYETNDLMEFSRLVKALRHTKARGYTLSDTPVYVGIKNSIEESLKTISGIKFSKG